MQSSTGRGWLKLIETQMPMSTSYTNREENAYEETTTQTFRLSVRGLRGANNYLPFHGNFGHPIRKLSAEVQ